MADGDSSVSRSDVEQATERWVQREIERTWPMVEDYCVISVGHYGRFRYLSIDALIPVAFLHGQEPTDEEKERLAKALTKVYKREFRHIWERVTREAGAAAAEASAQRRAQESGREQA